MRYIRAKIRCTSVTNYESVQQKVTFMAVTADSEENKTFSQYTPSLDLSMNITNPDAFNAFEPGKEYYLDFTAAE